MEKNGLLIGVQEKPKKVSTWIILSLQHVFAMFGATVLVPILTGLNIGVALVGCGVGTLIYIVATKAKSPVYLGSSFAYIGAILSARIALGGDLFDFSSVYTGLMIVGVIYVIIALIIKFAGKEWLKKALPPVVIGPMIIIIGLTLAPVAIEQSGLMLTGVHTLYYPHVEYSRLVWAVPVVAVITFLTTVGISSFAKGFLKIVPFLIAILVGWGFSAIFGLVDWRIFEGVRLFQLPSFTFIGTYSLNFTAVLTFAPLAFVTIAEHIGDHTVLGEIVGKDLLQDPGLDNTLIGDGVATLVSAAFGGPANTTYGENTGVVAITKVGSVYVTGLAAVIAILLGFVGPIQVFILSIPWAVIGGMTIVLYGLIAGNGVKVMIKDKTDLSEMRNIIIIATMLVIGLGGAAVPFKTIGSFEDGTLQMISGLTGMSLAAIVGIILNAVLPKTKSIK
jgi:uracil permease